MPLSLKNMQGDYLNLEYPSACGVQQRKLGYVFIGR